MFDLRTRRAAFKAEVGQAVLAGGGVDSTAEQFWQERRRGQALKKAQADREKKLHLPSGTMAQPLALQTAEALLNLILQLQGRARTS